MCRCALLVVVMLAVPDPVRGQSAPAPVPGADASLTLVDAAALERIKRRLEPLAPLRDAAIDAPPTFRVSVSQEGIDITKFWGEPDAVGANVHAPGGPWHHEYVNMVTPDEFRGWGYTAIVDNATMAKVAASSMASMLAIQYVPRVIKSGLRRSSRRLAKEEVQRELAEFYAMHPEARPVTPP